MTKLLLLFSLTGLLFISCGGDKTKATGSNNMTDGSTTNLKNVEGLDAVQSAYNLLADHFNKKNESLDCKERESINELSFDGISIEITEAKYCILTEKGAAIELNYFDGSPIGGKRFFIDTAEQLLAVEVFTFEEEETEMGLAIAEIPIAIFYYKDDKLLQALGPDDQESEADLSALQEETEKEWTVMKKDFFNATFHKTVNG
ncbi:MAG: hypothetical protein MK212_19375 [Saprospiraceae bacterium]|nr:hypothetical protein [Saprospiraceae bacterium]